MRIKAKHSRVSENETYVVDETILGGVVLGLESPEESLLSSEDLDRRRGVLGKVEKRSGVGDESSSDKLSNEGRQIGGDGGHSVSEVLVELSSVLGDRNDLVAEGVDVRHVALGNLGTHRELSSGLEGSLEVLGEDVFKRGSGCVGSEAWNKNKYVGCSAVVQSCPSALEKSSHP